MADRPEHRQQRAPGILADHLSQPAHHEDRAAIELRYGRHAARDAAIALTKTEQVEERGKYYNRAVLQWRLGAVAQMDRAAVS